MGKDGEEEEQRQKEFHEFTHKYEKREMLMPNGQQCATAQRTDEYYTIKVYAIDVFIV